MFEDLCRALCAQTRLRSHRQLPSATVCVSPKTGGKPPGCPSLLNYLFLGTEDQFHTHSQSIIDEMFRKCFVFHDLEGWRRQDQRVAVNDVFLQFFRRMSCLPAILWITPTWFLMGSDLPGLEIRNSVEELIWLPQAARNAGPMLLTMGPGRESIEVSIGDRLFFYPRERDCRPRLTKMTRLRVQMRDGFSKEAVSEECISLACPGMKEDDRWLRDAKIPIHSHEGFFRRVENEAYLDSCVATLATVHPSHEDCRADVDYLTLFFHRENAHPLEFSTSQRTFESFALHHPGVVDAICWRCWEEGMAK